jgi:hypothetical protein
MSSWPDDPKRAEPDWSLMEETYDLARTAGPDV